MSSDLLSSVLSSIADNWVALAAALVSLAAAVSSASQRRREMRIGWNRDLTAWAKEAMLALCEAQTLSGAFAEMPPEAAQAKAHELRARLAASVDHGRLFFENIKDKRPAVLDPLVGVVRLMREYNKHEPKALIAAIDTHRNNFWRRVQAVIDPRWMRKRVSATDVAAGDGVPDYANPQRDPAVGRARP